MTKTYSVKRGDSPWQLEPDKVQKRVNIREERLREAQANLGNVSAIQGAHHDSNYIIIDKANRNLTIFDKNNNPIYTTDKISTGESGNDYNTMTYVGNDGQIKNKQGNNSTPAGITVVDGVGSYHGHPTFIRSRINKDGSTENIASSLHWGNIGENSHASNGCVRVDGKALDEMAPLVGAGTKVYTLPEQPGSRFTLRGGHLTLLLIVLMEMILKETLKDFGTIII